MPEGLTNAPATFQRFMNDIFADMIDVIVIYIWMTSSSIPTIFPSTNSTFGKSSTDSCHDSFPMLSPIPLIVTLVELDITSLTPLGLIDSISSDHDQPDP